MRWYTRTIGVLLWLAAFMAWLIIFASRGFWWGLVGSAVFAVGILVWDKVTAGPARSR